MENEERLGKKIENEGETIKERVEEAHRDGRVWLVSARCERPDFKEV